MAITTFHSRRQPTIKEGERLEGPFRNSWWPVARSVEELAKAQESLAALEDGDPRIPYFQESIAFYDADIARGYAFAWRVYSYEGAVLAEREINGYDDSDFMATVWTDTEIIEVCWGTTRGWTYANGCAIDATPAVREAAAAWQYKDSLEAWKAGNIRQAAVVQKGRQVISLNGKNKGKTGMVLGDGVFGHRSHSWKVLFEDGSLGWKSDGTVAVVDPERYLFPDEVGEFYARQQAERWMPSKVLV